VTSITKAVIAAAGFGTRFLPQTKAMPKEMLPLVDKPIIQHVVEELVAAGIKDIIIVGSSNKRAIEDHFDLPNEELLSNLRSGGPEKEILAKELEDIANLANFIYVRQKGPYGTGTPLLNVAPIIGNEPFIYTYPDDLTIAHPNGFQQLINIYNEFGSSVFQCLNVSSEVEYDRYGILSGDEIRPGLLKMNGIVEKPGKANAPTNFANTGSFLLMPDVFNYIHKGMDNLVEGAEFQVTADVFEPMLRDGKPMYGYVTQNATRYDTGTTMEYLKTQLAYSLGSRAYGSELKEFLEVLLQDTATDD
jgi:UTP--glucose-1-phosphate uridylyltransferase